MRTMDEQNASNSLVVAGLTVNPFQENTYVLYDDTKECIIIDPGCYDAAEQRELRSLIEREGLTPVRLINTHAHLDHIFGNAFVAETYGLELEMHRGELPVLEAAVPSALRYGIPFPQPSPAPTRFLEGGDTVQFGHTTLRVLFTPGHSPASISFYCAEAGILMAGDVLFRDSIGRTDLPGGDHQTLLQSIREQFWPLPTATKVYPGHGPATTIGYERVHNPFLR